MFFVVFISIRKLFKLEDNLWLDIRIARTLAFLTREFSTAANFSFGCNTAWGRLDVVQGYRYDLFLFYWSLTVFVFFSFLWWSNFSLPLREGWTSPGTKFSRMLFSSTLARKKKRPFESSFFQISARSWMCSIVVPSTCNLWRCKKSVVGVRLKEAQYSIP